nr:MAG TPA: hypothetical protein [Caudoviricetes sp.]
MSEELAFESLIRWRNYYEKDRNCCISFNDEYWTDGLWRKRDKAV